MAIKNMIQRNLFLRIAIVCAYSEAKECDRMVLTYQNKLVEDVAVDVIQYINSLEQVIRIGTQNHMHLEWSNLDMVNLQSQLNKSNIEAKLDKNNYMILYSGGIDCTVVAYYLRSLSKKITLLNFKYGQTNFFEENACFQYHSKKLNDQNVDFKQIELTNFYKQIADNSGLLSDRIILTEENKKLEYVPFRNTIFIAIALSICIEKGIGNISTGSQADDAISPDNSKEYYEVVQKLISNQKITKNILIEPLLIGIGGKPETIYIGEKLGVNYKYTWTCHSKSKSNNIKQMVQCGVCSDCSTRYSAFKKIGINDPLQYEKIPSIRSAWSGWGKDAKNILEKIN